MQRKLILLAIAAAMAIAFGCAPTRPPVAAHPPEHGKPIEAEAPQPPAHPEQNKPLETEAPSMQSVHDFLQECGVYYIATADGDQPRVRPFGTAAIYE